MKYLIILCVVICTGCFSNRTANCHKPSFNQRYTTKEYRAQQKQKAEYYRRTEGCARVICPRF